MNPAHYKPISVDLTKGRPCAFQNPFPEFWNGVQTCDAALQAQPPKHFGPRSIPPDKRDYRNMGACYVEVFELLAIFRTVVMTCVNAHRRYPRPTASRATRDTGHGREHISRQTYGS